MVEWCRDKTREKVYSNLQHLVRTQEVKVRDSKQLLISTELNVIKVGLVFLWKPSIHDK